MSEENATLIPTAVLVEIQAQAIEKVGGMIEAMISEMEGDVHQGGLIVASHKIFWYAKQLRTAPQNEKE